MRRAGGAVAAWTGAAAVRGGNGEPACVATREVVACADGAQCSVARRRERARYADPETPWRRSADRRQAPRAGGTGP